MVSLDSTQVADRAKAVDYLRRTYINLYPDDQNTWQDLLANTGYLLTGEPEVVFATLSTYAENNYALRKPIFADELESI